MKKRTVKRHHHAHRHVARQATRQSGDYIVLVRGWMLVVAIALMLGVGAIVGNFINAQINATTPTVAGVTTSR